MSTTIESADGVHVVVDGRRLVSFAGCDYLGLSRDPDVVEAAREALPRYGLGAGASRTTTGTWTSHRKLERALAKWMQTADAVLLPTGFMAPAALAVMVRPHADFVLLDAAAHPALVEAASMTGLLVRRYEHFDAFSAARGVRDGRPLVMTDAVDVARGRTAPLAALHRLVERADGAMIVDDAHGIGVLGPDGRGTAALLRATGDRVHIAGSLSKSLGAHGGFVPGPRGLCDAIRVGFAAYAGATPIPPSTAAGAVVAVRHASTSLLRRRLRANASLLRRRFLAMRLAPPRPGLPWFAVSGRPLRELKAMERGLLRAGFLVPHLRYFSAPPEGFLKIAVTAAHEPAHIDALADVLASQLASGSKRPRVSR